MDVQCKVEVRELAVQVLQSNAVTLNVVLQLDVVLDADYVAHILDGNLQGSARRYDIVLDGILDGHLQAGRNDEPLSQIRFVQVRVHDQSILVAYLLQVDVVLREGYLVSQRDCPLLGTVQQVTVYFILLHLILRVQRYVLFGSLVLFVRRTARLAG